MISEGSIPFAILLILHSERKYLRQRSTLRGQETQEPRTLSLNLSEHSTISKRCAPFSNRPLQGHPACRPAFWSFRHRSKYDLRCTCISFCVSLYFFSFLRFSFFLSFFRFSLFCCWFFQHFSLFFSDFFFFTLAISEWTCSYFDLCLSVTCRIVHGYTGLDNLLTSLYEERLCRVPCPVLSLWEHCLQYVCILK